MKGLVYGTFRENARLSWDGRNGESAFGKCVVRLCDKALKGKRLARLIRLCGTCR